MSTPKPYQRISLKKHIVGGARVSIAELLENHKTTERRLQHWLALIFYYCTTIFEPKYMNQGQDRLLVGFNYKLHFMASFKGVTHPK